MALNNIISSIIENTTDIEFDSTKHFIGSDGLIRCKVCGEKLETFFQGMKVPCVCKCFKEKEKKEEEERIQTLKNSRINELRKMSLLSDRYSNVSFANTELVNNETFLIAYKRCMKYCELAQDVYKNGYGIYLYGDSGCGKTHLTACMVKDLTEKLYSTLMTNFTEIAKSIRESFRFENESENEIINKLIDVDFLFIDDIGTEQAQRNGQDTWLQEKIYDIINKRYNAKKPTIFTSNYSLRELKERGVMHKTVDRIYAMSTAIMEIKGGISYRITHKDTPIF